MADRPTEPPSKGQPYNRGREDTVVRPMPTAEQMNGETRTEAKVLPPMPTNGKPAAKAPTSLPAQSRTARPKPSGPPPQARAAAPTAPPPTAPPTTQPAPVVPVAPPAARQEQQPKRTKSKAQKPPKPAKPAKQQQQAQKTAAAPRPGRRARLRMTRIDPWSVMKTSFLLSIALGIVTVVSVLMVWSVLGAADVWSSINQTVQDVVGGQDASNFDIEDYIGTRRVVGFTIIVAAVDVVLLTAIATLGAFLYNMSASLLGGIEVTLAEDN